jgi:ABC-type branched-subunit amino acid transport system substrate-binding protein
MLLRSRTLSILVLMVLLSSLFAGCLPQSSANQKTLTIAVVEADFGEEANPDSQSVYAGVKLAAEQVNDAGGNVRVVVKPYADGNDPIQAIQVAGQVVSEGADAVIGHASIETSKAASDVYETNKIPVINIIPVTEALIEKHPYQFNITYTAESEAAYLANYLTRIDSKFSVGIIHTDAAWSLFGRRSSCRCWIRLLSRGRRGRRSKRS